MTGLLSVLAGQALGRTRLVARKIALLLTVFVLGIAGLGFLLAGLWLWLARDLGAEAASLILGLVLLALCLTCFLLARGRAATPALAPTLPQPGDGPLPPANVGAMAAFVVGFVLARRWPPNRP